MCSKVMCNKCQKPTWSGCGEHIEQALVGVALKDRCQGHENDPKEPGLISRLLGGKKEPKNGNLRVNVINSLPARPI